MYVHWNHEWTCMQVMCVENLSEYCPELAQFWIFYHIFADCTVLTYPTGCWKLAGLVIFLTLICFSKPTFILEKFVYSLGQSVTLLVSIAGRKKLVLGNVTEKVRLSLPFRAALTDLVLSWFSLIHVLCLKWNHQKKCFFFKSRLMIFLLYLYILMNQNSFTTILIFDLLGCSVPDSQLCNSFF